MPIFHPRQIVFVTRLPEEYRLLVLQTRAAHHQFVYSKEATLKAMKELLDAMPMIDNGGTLNLGIYFKSYFCYNLLTC